MFEISKNKRKVTISNIRDFDPDQVFDCGQCFRWKKEEKADIPTWYGVVNGKFAKLGYRDNGGGSGTIIIESFENDENFWIFYLDLSRDYGSVKKKLSEKDPIMVRAIEEGRGIRILRQDPWETLISFIISQNSNIPRIKGCIESLCREFGEEIGEYKGEKLFSFPGYEVLSTLKENDLKVCRLGYRAKYIAEAARQVARDGGAMLKVASSMDDQDVLQYLLNLSGVGPKVASCIMLFSMGKLNIFPIDVWVKRVMNRLYSIREDDMAGMKEYAEKHFGKYGGIAQQYLFYYIRRLSVTNPDVYKALKMTEKTKEVTI